MIIVKNIYFDRKYTPDHGDAVTTPQPVVSWTVTGGDGLYQTSYRLTVTDGEKTVYTASADTDGQTVRVSETLPTDRELLFTVTVTANDGQTSSGSRTAVCARELSAPWICAKTVRPNAPVDFFRDITVNKPVSDAYLYCCGIGYQAAYVNGISLLDDYSPAFSDYTKTCYYKLYVVSGLLREGENRLSVTVADGWRHIDSRFVERNLGGRTIEFDGVPCLSAELHIRYEDGDEEFIKTGEDWSCVYGQTTYSNIFDGETVDETAEPTAPKNAKLYDGEPLGTRRLQLLQDTDSTTYKAVSVLKVGDRYVFDFGQNIAGVVYLSAEGLKRGDKVTLLYGEMLNADGTVYTAPLREAKCTDVFISSGKDTERFSPRFTFHGFRYVEVTGLPFADKDSVHAVAFYTGMTQKYEYNNFDCGSPLVNRIHYNAYMTERNNMMSILSDCPQRDERMGWLNDATVRFEETPYNFDIGAMFPKIVRDVLDAQRENGMIGCTAPFIFGQLPADPVCSSFLIAAERAYMFTGNTDVIREGFEGFERWEKVLLDRSDDYIVNYSYYGDWAAPSYACVTEEFACSAVTPGILMSTGYSYFNCRLLEKFSNILGYTEKEKYYKETAEKIADAFCRKWVDTETGVIECGSMGAYAFALRLGILPEKCRKAAARHMRDDLVSRNYMFTTGNLTMKYLFEMLAEYGYIEEAWKLLHKTDYPSFGYEINHGATTVWERFELKKNPDMNSHNHPMYGASDGFLHEYIAGVKITGAGCRHIRVKPYMPKDLYYCRDVITTLLGDVEVKWIVEFGKRILYLNIPFGMTADVDFCGVKKTVTSGSHVFSIDL